MRFAEVSLSTLRRRPDDDWAEINKLRKAYQEGGKHALCKAYSELGKSPVRYVRVVSAFYPREVTESIRDAMAKRGLTVEDILEMIRKRADQRATDRTTCRKQMLPAL